MLEALNSGLSMPSLSMPSLSALPAPRAASASTGPSQSIGDIVVNVQVATNADPNTIARAVEQIVMGQARGAFTNGAM